MTIGDDDQWRTAPTRCSLRIKAWRCSRVAPPGRKRCPQCNERTQRVNSRRTDALRERYAQRKAGGMCAYCGRVAVDRYATCTDCRLRRSKNWYARTRRSERLESSLV